MKEKIEYLKKYLKDKELDTAIKELEKGTPVQYIVGNVNFYGYDFKVNKNTLIPRFETELLVEKTYNYIKKYFDTNNIRILDIGTGTGCIAITLNKLLNCDVHASDISKEALEVAKENNRINNANVNFIVSDVFENINCKYDVIISNPPYISYDEEIMDIVKNNEPNLALYAPNEGLYFYEEILKNVHKYINNNGLIAFEIGYNQGEKIRKLSEKYLKKYDFEIKKDMTGKDRMVFIRVTDI